MLLRMIVVAVSLLCAWPVLACSKMMTQASMSTVDPITTASMSETVSVGEISIDGYWVKAMLPGQPVAGGFLKITNKGESDDRLLSATSPKSGRIELHEMAMKNDVMEMRALEDGIVIAAGATVELAPGGLHLMFFDVSETFKEGDTVAVTLAFEKAGLVELMLPVIAKAMHH